MSFDIKKIYYVTDIIIKYLVFFSPLSFILGNFLLDLNMSLISIIFLFYIFKENSKKYFFNLYFKCFIVISIYFFINSIISANPELSLESSLFYMRFVVFPLAIWYVIDQDKRNLKLISKIFITVYLFVIFDSFIQYFFNQNLFGFNYNGYRLSGVFGEELILGSYLSRFFPLVCAFAIVVFDKKIKHIIFLVITYLLLDSIIYISGERVAFFYLILTTISLLFLINENRKIRFTTIFLSIILLTLISITNPSIKQRMIDTTIKQTNFLGEDKHVFSSEHEAIYSVSINIFKDNYFFGIGPKLYREYCNFDKYRIRFGCSTHPHNSYIQLLTETGIIGAIPFFLIFILISFLLIKQFYHINFTNKTYLNNYFVFLVLALFISLWPFAPTGNVFSNSINFIYFYPVGFILQSLYNKEHLCKQ
jgi:O-antigen ligase